jgi:cation diffusion facilitator family transporter
MTSLPSLPSIPKPPWQHDHVFDASNPLAERSTRVVMWITAMTMVAEIGAGWWFNSMALLADGWHMSSHAVAIGLSAFAYGAARRYAQDPRFAFGTWKMEVLGAFASAVFLLGVAALMVVGSLERLWTPQTIAYPQAMGVAALGLVVNAVCAWILGRAHHHGDSGHSHAAHSHDSHPHPDPHANHHVHHGHGPSHTHNHHQPHPSHSHAHPHAHSEAHPAHQDLNLKSAYVHVLADAATSVLAIVALAGGWLYGWSWLDPAMGLVGAILVAVWAKGLLSETAAVLLDREMDHPVVQGIRQSIESARPHAQTQVADLHVWRVGKRVYSCAITVLTTDPQLTAVQVREHMAAHEEIVHATIEIHVQPAPDA